MLFYTTLIHLHHRFYLVKNWRPRNVDQILQENPQVYLETLDNDLFDECNTLDDLHDLDLIDNDGYEINIYDGDGF